MKTFVGAALLSLILLSAQSALAGIEITGSYGVDGINPSDLASLDKADLSSTYTPPTSLAGWGADVRYVFPLVKFSVGGRYESWSASQSLGGIDQKITDSRTALTAGFRLIDFGLYLGVIGSYGISNTMKVTTTGLSDASPSSAQSYSIGAETGLKLSRFIIGAEVGYLSMVGTDMQASGTSVTVNGSKTNLDLSGAYGKILIGFSL